METVGAESSLASTAPSQASDILPATALDKPKEKVCGVKGNQNVGRRPTLQPCQCSGGQHVRAAYGEAASAYILPLLIGV